MSVKAVVCVTVDAMPLGAEPVCVMFCATLFVTVKLGLTAAVANAVIVLDTASVIRFAAVMVWLSAPAGVTC